MNCTVLGSGTWGSSLAQVLSDNKHNVIIYGIDKGEVDDFNLNHKNTKYFGDTVLLNLDILLVDFNNDNILSKSPNKNLTRLVFKSHILFISLRISINSLFFSGFPWNSVIYL